MLTKPIITKPFAGAKCSFVTKGSNNVLRCIFTASFSKPVSMQFTAVGATAGTITDIASAMYKPCKVGSAPNTVKNMDTVTVWEPVLGSCCDKDYGCSAGVAKIPCQRAGGMWSPDMDACYTGRFCTGACCTNGNSNKAQCWMTVKAACPGKWDGSSTCFDQNYCPRPCLGKCMQCSPASDTCCPGYSCQQSGRYGRYYCVPDCVPYKPHCAGPGGFCGLTAGGVKCCGGLDCIVADGGVSVCAPQNTCKPRGSACKGFGECGSGLYCAMNGKCELAACKSKGKYPRSASAQAQKNIQDYQCNAFHAASCSAL
ncbi:hypothetical protein OEZ86_008891 [Tetradesmus obliquus]|nr:hypothetical protein OEZ86_008891 [Tetradesmus obliquus]